MLPSISHSALRSPNHVSSGRSTKTGRRGAIFSSKNFHIASGSAIWVSASTTPCMSVLLLLHFENSNLLSLGYITTHPWLQRENAVQRSKFKVQCFGRFHPTLNRA